MLAGFRLANTCDDPHKGGIGPAVLNGIGDRLQLGGIVIGYAAPVHLIPVQDLLALLAIRDQVVTDSILLAGCICELCDALGLERPACTGEAVLGRVNRLAGALGGEVADE